MQKHKSGFLVLAMITLPVLFVAGQTAKPAFTLTTSTSAGFMIGQAVEDVYNQAVSRDYKNSELTWPFQPIEYAGAGISVTTALGLYGSLDVRQAFGGKVGTMTDSDFLNGDGVKTHFSQSDTYLERAVFIDLKIGYPLSARMPVDIAAFIGFSYMDFKWSARDGYYQYPTTGQDYSFDTTGALIPGTWTPWSAGVTRTPIYGTGILYEQATLMATVGLDASYRIAGPFTLGAFCMFSPLVYGYTEDNHELRMVDFYSTLAAGLMAEPSLSLEYAIKPNAAIRLALAYRWIGNLKGDITQVDQGTTATSSGGSYYAGPDTASSYTNASGASNSMLDASLSFRLAF